MLAAILDTNVIVQAAISSRGASFRVLNAHPSLTRDVSDTKFLSLAAESLADNLVTNDRRHLLPLRQYGVTRIVTPAQFLAQLPEPLA